jgi:hypothetical protein
MPPVNDLLGKKFGRLAVVKRVENNRFGKSRWRCLCQCGNFCDVDGSSLIQGLTSSCGCLHLENLLQRPPALRHGHASASDNSPTYVSWRHMWERCTNENAINFQNYGGRGITVCRRWRLFEHFLDDMGERPAGTSIDRIDSDGNYTPGNCRWATPKQQADNRRAVYERDTLRHLRERN